MARSAPFWSRTGVTSTTPAVVRLPSNWRQLKVSVDALSYAGIGTTYAAPAVATVNGITTISSLSTPTAGTFVIRVMDGGQVLATTAAIPYNETAANIKTALVATGYFASGDITAAGGALPTAVTLTWTGVYAGVVPSIDVVSSVTGGVIQARTTTQSAGNGSYGYVAASSQEVWDSPGDTMPGQFFYVATVSGAGNYSISAYR